METLEQIRKEAKRRLLGYCHVCPQCNGVACAGEVPGMGGTVNGDSFKRNVEKWSTIRVNMRSIHDVTEPILETTLWGEKVAAPIIAAPLLGAAINMGGAISDDQLISSILYGSQKANLLAMIGDGPDPTLFKIVCQVLKGVKGIPVIKPLQNTVILERIHLLEELQVSMVGIDIDAAALINMVSHGREVGPKTLKSLKYITSNSPLPLFLKGIMTPEEGWLAYEAGFKAIVVSNHGGRVLHGTPSTAEVLPAIVKRLEDTTMIILVDGGIRSGLDVLRALALGADGVLIGRPLIIGAVGGGEDGVYLILKKLLKELRLAMISTGTPSVSRIDSSHLIYRARDK